MCLRRSCLGPGLVKSPDAFLDSAVQGECLHTLNTESRTLLSMSLSLSLFFLLPLSLRHPCLSLSGLSVSLTVILFAPPSQTPTPTQALSQPSLPVQLAILSVCFSLPFTYPNPFLCIFSLLPVFNSPSPLSPLSCTLDSPPPPPPPATHYIYSHLALM